MSNTQFLQEPEPLDREQSIEAYIKLRLQSLDRAIGGYTSVSLQGLTGNVDLTPTQAKHRVIVLTGAPSGAVTLRIPHATGANADIIFVNACTGSNSTVTVKSTGANAGVPVATGDTRHVRHDGESAYPTRVTFACRVYNSAAIAIGNATATALTFNSERRDDGSLHSTGSNTDQIIVPRDGWGIVWANVEFDSNATGFRTVSMRKNGSSTIIGAEQAGAVSGSGTIIGATCLDYFTKGDVLRCYVYQSSGVTLNVAGGWGTAPSSA
jgi:hypothetical protein